MIRSLLAFLWWKLFGGGVCPICLATVAPERDLLLCVRQEHSKLIDAWGKWWHLRCGNVHPDFGMCCHYRGHQQRHFSPGSGGWSW